MARQTDFSLLDKYLREQGQIYLSGIQALVRLPMDQHRADRRAGLNTATFISGYRGSPLGGLDLTLERLPDLLKEHHIHFASGVNEDLAATAIFGSQMAGLFPGAKYYCGLWVAFKVVTNVADESGTVEVGPDRVRPILPRFEVDGRPFSHQLNPTLLAPYSLEM